MKDLIALFLVVFITMFMFIFAVDRTIAQRDIRDSGVAEDCLFDVNCRG